MDKQVKKVFEGSLQATGLRVAIVCSRFNELFTTRLLEGAIDTLVRHGATADQLAVAWVPGAFEVPLVARKFAATGRYDAVIALGLVIQGATPHAGYINAQVASSLAAIGQDTGVPVIYGVVTTENLEQALERSGTKHGNRGATAAQAAIEMANLVRALDKDRPR